jgi:hypothetical protein
VIEMQVLSDWHFIKRKTTQAIFIIHYLQSAAECTKHIGTDACPKADSV